MYASSGKSSRFFDAYSFKSYRRLAALVALSLALSSCFVIAPQRPRPRPTTAQTSVQQMLNQRAEALSKRDIEGFLSPMTPEAREVERPLARGLLSVPTTKYTLKLRPSAELDGSIFGGVTVDLGYVYEGLPEDNVFHATLVYDIARVGEKWIISKAQLQSDALQPAWMTGPVEHSRFDVFLVMHRPGLENPARTLETAKAARESLQAKVTYPLEQSYLILLARNLGEYQTLAATDAPASSIAQAETTYEITPASIQVRSRHIVVNLEALYSTGSPLETLQHELGHLALARDTRPFTPTWVSESAAMFLSDSRPRDTWRVGVRNRRFAAISFSQMSRTGTLGAHDLTGRAASIEYAYAAGAAYYLVETFGADAFWEFYRSYAEVPARKVYEQIPEGASNDESRFALQGLSGEVTAEALQRVFGITEADLDVRVRDWISKQV